MPRIARKDLGTSFFHVMVQGINKEYIFKKERYMNQYKNFLKKNLQDTEIKIVAFCIMSNHAHMLINTENVNNLSNYMQKVNGSYARYYNYMEDERVGYVFRDRYKSEPILDRRQLIQCIKYIHNNPVKAEIVDNPKDYKYSSFNYFNQHKFNHSIFSKEEMEYICNNEIEGEDDFLDINSSANASIKKGIVDFVEKENIEIFEIFEKRVILKRLVKFLKTEKNIKYVDIRKELEIPRGVMNNLI